MYAQAPGLHVFEKLTLRCNIIVFDLSFTESVLVCVTLAHLSHTIIVLLWAFVKNVSFYWKHNVLDHTKSIEINKS